ncbi:MAG: DUF4380 domain-containing protein [Pedosphaera sp.]|nr:DUF4380 domain-containing protein [Pedosphaera sp.]
MHRRHFIKLATVIAPLAGCVSKIGSGVRIRREPYQGWSDAIRMENDLCWVVIVPSIGRVMQFGLKDRPGVFWENPQLLGKSMPLDPWGTAVGSFGGDKTWPAPQSSWNWPPPDVFDRVGLAAQIEGSSVVMTSPVSPLFGIVTERRIRLAPHAALMSIDTIYRKLSGDPMQMAVWVITQLKDPDRVFFTASENPAFVGGWSAQWKTPADKVRVKNGLVSMRREPQGSYKIGNDSKKIVWVGAKDVLKIEVSTEFTSSISRRMKRSFTNQAEPWAAPPDEGCRVELYTNGGDADYVELETLGPSALLKSGETLGATNTYSLGLRTSADAQVEALHYLP